MRLLGTYYTNGDSRDSDRLLETYETKEDSPDSERVLGTYETQKDYGGLMRLRENWRLMRL